MAQSNTQTTAYTKLRDGSWGVRLVGRDRGGKGAAVRVAKRDGSTKDEFLGDLVWRSDDGAISIWRIAARAQQRTMRAQSRGAGQAVAVRGYSSYCTGRTGCGCYDCQ